MVTRSSAQTRLSPPGVTSYFTHFSVKQHLETVKGGGRNAPPFNLTVPLCDLRHWNSGSASRRGTSFKARPMMKWGYPSERSIAPMIKIRKKRREKLGITHFGLMGHEIAVLKSTVESTPNLAADFELREPDQAVTCNIVVVNQDSKVAASWWNFFQKQNPSAVPMFLTNSKQTPDDSAYCKRPFTPSFLQAAFQDLVSKIRVAA